MTMLHSFHENLELNDSEINFEVLPSYNQSSPAKSEVHLFAEKLSMPKCTGQLVRPRLRMMLSKSSMHFGATLILGRSGTGKTVLAADLASQYEKVAWYSIDSADNDWNVFSKYFTASFNEPILDRYASRKEDEIKGTSPKDISYFVENLFGRLSAIDPKKPRLIVVDNAHYIFDAEWFTDFFHTLICSLLPNTHLLVLSRCKPPLPLWRLRSKQTLGVIDEKLLAFNFEETQNLFKDHPMSSEVVKSAYIKSFGRISKLKEIAKSL